MKPLDVGCPTCGARPGEPCTQRRSDTSKFHLYRRNRAANQDAVAAQNRASLIPKETHRG